MADRVALITGGARGIGRTIALALGAHGWDVSVCYRTSRSDAEGLVAALRSQGRRALAVQADVSRPEAAKDLVRAVEGELGRIDALINCAGPYHRIALMQETVEGWHEMFDNNLHPVFYLAREVAPGMIERKWGRIVNFSMANADQNVGQPGITANTISPGFIDSGSAPLDEMSKMIKNIPAGYVGDTKDAAGAVLFLLSDEARYINGSNIHLSGAWGI
jgi:3-oxoacyl-[acyl-carrier protein] reductase